MGTSLSIWGEGVTEPIISGSMVEVGDQIVVGGRNSINVTN